MVQDDPYLRKDKIKMLYAFEDTPFKKEDNDRRLKKHKICTDIIHKSTIGNWQELNKELIEDKLECSICYNIIFYHESIC